MEYNLVFYFSAPSLMQLGDGIGKMVLTRHPVFSAAAHQSRQTVQSNLYASSSTNNQHFKTRSFLLTLSKLSRQHQIHLKHFHITAPNCISHFFLRPHSVAEGVQRHWGTNRALRALGMRCTTEPRRELKHNEQQHL